VLVSTAHAVPPVAPTTTATNPQVETTPAAPVATTQPKPEIAPVAPKAIEPAIAKPPPVKAPKPAPAPSVAPPEKKPAESTVVAPKPGPTPPPTTPPVRLEPGAALLPTHTEKSNAEPAVQAELVKEAEMPAPPPAQVAAATQPEKSFDPKNMLFIGGAILVLAIALFVLLQRRARATPHASLITRSMDQDKK
jgi:hypothetical protein